MSEFIFSEEQAAVRIRVTVTPPATYGLAVAAGLAGVEPELLRFYCEVGLLGPERQGAADPSFDDDAIYAVRRVEQLRRHYGVDRRALPLIGGLLREVERLQAEVRFLRGP